MGRLDLPDPVRDEDIWFERRPEIGSDAHGLPPRSPQGDPAKRLTVAERPSLLAALRVAP